MSRRRQGSDGVAAAEAGVDGRAAHRRRAGAAESAATGSTAPDARGRRSTGGRKFAEFCENGAKAVAEEATKRVVTPDFFARHSIADLDGRPEYWLSQQGRLTHPMVLRPGDDHYRPIDWDDAYRLIADELHALEQPQRGGVLHLGSHQQ